MAIFKPTLLTALAATAATSHAQSANPGVGSNPKPKARHMTLSPSAALRTDWLNTGITGEGWTPPFVALSDVLYITPDQFYSGIRSPCAQYDSYFQSTSAKYTIDRVILAVIAMQESPCNASAGGSTPGLMQLSCDNYPNGLCTDSLQDKVDAGTNYLKFQLDAAGGNAIQAFGAYNGWLGLNSGKGLTEGYPCSVEGKANGVPQNLDYLHQVLNGWFMGLDVYGGDNWIGTYMCDQSCGNGSKW